jgi:hypothetical protein
MPWRYYGGSSYWPNLASSRSRTGHGQERKPKWVEEKELASQVTVHLAAGAAAELGGLILSVPICLLGATDGEGATLPGTEAWYEDDGALTLKRLARDQGRGKWLWTRVGVLYPDQTLRIRDHRGRELGNPVLCLRCYRFSGQLVPQEQERYDSRTGQINPADTRKYFACRHCERRWPAGNWLPTRKRR